MGLGLSIIIASVQYHSICIFNWILRPVCPISPHPAPFPIAPRFPAVPPFCAPSRLTPSYLHPSLPRRPLCVLQNRIPLLPNLIKPTLYDPTLLPSHPIALQLPIADAPRSFVSLVVH